MSDRTSIEKELLDNQREVDHAIMVQLATTDDSQVIVDDLLSKDIPTQLRAFMTIKARNALLRIIKITDILEDLEDTYMERALSDKDGMDMRAFDKVLETVSAMLDRSIATVSSIINDKELSLVVENTTNVYNDNRTMNKMTVFKDQESREKLRTIALKLIDKMGYNPSDVINSQPSSDEILVDGSDILEVEVSDDVLP